MHIHKGFRSHLFAIVFADVTGKQVVNILTDNEIPFDACVKVGKFYYFQDYRLRKLPSRKCTIQKVSTELLKKMIQDGKLCGFNAKEYESLYNHIVQVYIPQMNILDHDNAIFI